MKYDYKSVFIVPVFAMILGFSFSAMSQGNWGVTEQDKYIKMDESLKLVIKNNPQSSASMTLFSFVEKNRVTIDIYKLSASTGKQFVPQDKLALMLYEKYIEAGFLPVVSVLETNKQFLEAISSKN